MSNEKQTAFPKGWLKEQIKSAQEEIKKWPEWQKKALKIDLK